MRCSYPVKIKDPKNPGEWIEVPCGRCTACRVNYGLNWSIRVKHELEMHDFALWVCLTYNDVHLSLQNLEYDNGCKNSLERRELQLFLKNFRRDIEPLKVRFFACGEYGDEFNRPHYHIIIFGISPEHPYFKDKYKFYQNGQWKGWRIDNLPSWPHGFVEIDKDTAGVNAARYVAKYMLKKYKGKDSVQHYAELGIKPEFIAMSLKPGIGATGIDKHAKYYRDNKKCNLGGRSYNMSRYMVKRVSDTLGVDLDEEIKFEHQEYRKSHPENIKKKQEFNGHQQEINLRKGKR